MVRSGATFLTQRFQKSEMVWRSALALFLILFLASPSIQRCRAEDVARGPFVSKEWGFSIDYPRGIFEERLVDDRPGLALVLSGSGGFPTFTVTVARGEYEPSSSKSHAERVVREYHEAGFRDARVVRISRYVHRGVPLRAPLVTLLFMRSQSGEGRGCQDHTGLGGVENTRCNGESETVQQIVRSKVLFISTPNQHYVLTYLNDAENSDPHLARMLFDSFVVTPLKVGTSEDVEGSDAGLPVGEPRNAERLSRFFSNPLARLWGALSPTFFSILDSSSWERPAELESREEAESDEPSGNRRDSRAWYPPSSPADSFWRDDKRRDDGSESHFFLSQLAKLVLPTSSGGQLMSMLMLFASGVIVNRWRRR